jgi:hypothetical protein
VGSKRISNKNRGREGALAPDGVGYTSKQIAGSKLIGSPDRIKSISKKNRDKEGGACPARGRLHIEADYRRMIGFGVESISKKIRGEEGGLGSDRAIPISPVGANPIPEGLASHRVARPWEPSSNVSALSVGRQVRRP